MVKSKTAFEFSVQRYLQGFRRAYLWTFTFPQVVETESFRYSWHRLICSLRYHRFQGVRVFELHPGGHGYHVHVVTKFRYEVEFVRVLANLAGFGRINVKVINAYNAVYIGKHLHKQARVACLKGMRLWSGILYKCNAVRDIIVNGGVSEIWNKIHDDYLGKVDRNYLYLKGYAKRLYKIALLEQFVKLGDFVPNIILAYERGLYGSQDIRCGSVN